MLHVDVGDALVHEHQAAFGEAQPHVELHKVDGVLGMHEQLMATVRHLRLDRGPAHEHRRGAAVCLEPGRPAKASAPCGSSDGRSAASGFSAGGVTLSVIASSAESSPSALGTPKSRPQYSTYGISFCGVLSTTATPSRRSTT